MLCFVSLAWAIAPDIALGFVLTGAQAAPADFGYQQGWPRDAEGIFNSRLQSSRAFRSNLLFLLIEGVLCLKPRRDGHVTRGHICICSEQRVLGYRNAE